MIEKAINLIAFFMHVSLSIGLKLKYTIHP